MTAADKRPVRLTTLSQLDMRTNAAREAMALRDAITSDTGGDPSAAMAVLIEQAACVSALCSDYGRRYLSGRLNPADIPSWLSSVNSLKRLGETIGLQRVKKEIDIRAYLAGKAYSEAPEADREAIDEAVAASDAAID